MKASTGPLADAIRALRRALGQTQEGMARALGVSKASIQFWEAGKHVPGGKWLLKLQALCPNAALQRLFASASDPPHIVSSGNAQAKYNQSGEVLRLRQDAELSINTLYELAASGSGEAREELRRCADLLARRARRSRRSQRRKKLR